MGQEEDDADILEELKAEFAQLEEKVEETRMTTLLSGEYDNSNAILQFHAGAGGTEAQDWAQMLYRMYTRWAERHGFVYKILDYEEGDEAGIKSAAISIEGENAYGLLKSENGVHRLVRVSPFDANARRQTSFAARPRDLLRIVLPGRNDRPELRHEFANLDRSDLFCEIKCNVSFFFGHGTCKIRRNYDIL